MAVDESRIPLEQISAFEWDETKRASNLEKHGIDFEDATEIFYGDILVSRSNRKNEERWIALGEIQGRIIAVAYTWRKNALRIISARRARKNEEREYRNAKMGRSPEG
ncbi:BrnT family toxin [Bradyrhizobium cajani]|uniref:BrnT family toxin n=1 Tax=Bradyrhizobium cajani TaxID=1928661 RepID=A0A844TAF4_9BRAD|nr:BrnT family toxin [Bradyrhizobium cajani]MCP3371167.1 BrnT family toxin [Bradyrhizobium cajani]MVT72452.1 BrnT family toxin [Bradyrhizobium cajani]